MKLGMFMHPIHDYRRGYHTLLNEDMDVIRCADAVGFDEVWLGEHFALPSEPIQSPLMLMAALIPETERIKLCTGVICLPYQHPRSSPGRSPSSTTCRRGASCSASARGRPRPTSRCSSSSTRTEWR